MARRRRHHRRMRGQPVVIGLTGSIAMGKSTAARLMRYLRVPVFDADLTVHKLMAPGSPTAAAIAARFPGVFDRKSGVDRQALGAIVFADPKALRDLETILHPLVHRDRQRFLQRAGARRCRVVAVDVPLLFEGGGADQYDAVMVVSAPAFLQRQRALRRTGMTAAKLRRILARQMPDAQKRARADVVIPSGLGKRESLHRIAKFLKVTGRARNRS